MKWRFPIILCSVPVFHSLHVPSLRYVPFIGVYRSLYSVSGLISISVSFGISPDIPWYQIPGILPDTGAICHDSPWQLVSSGSYLWRMWSPKCSNVGVLQNLFTTCWIVLITPVVVLVTTQTPTDISVSPVFWVFLSVGSKPTFSTMKWRLPIFPYSRVCSLCCLLCSVPVFRSFHVPSLFLRVFVFFIRSCRFLVCLSFCLFGNLRRQLN
jgi:hypothetical protein